jgi:hypothetical protein
MSKMETLEQGWPTFWTSGPKLRSKCLGGPKISSKKAQRAKKSIFTGKYITVHAEKVQNKTCRAIQKVSAGHIWPAGPGLATPALEQRDC